MKYKMMSILLIVYTSVGNQALKADMKDEATISAETLISKATSILSNFISAESITAAATTFSSLPDLESPAAKEALKNLAIADKASSASRLIQPYDQQKSTKSVATWLKNYQENKQFYTTPDQQQRLIDLKTKLEAVAGAENKARELHNLLSQKLKN